VSYDIIRKHQDMAQADEIVERGVSLEEAQEHCSRDDTSGDGWMDVYVPTERRHHKLEAHPSEARLRYGG
jgi:hypothetical protein